MRGPERWRRLPGPARIVVVLVAAVLVVEVSLTLLEDMTGGSGPGGPASSSYATQAEGLAAYAELVARAGHPVRRLRAKITEIDPAATLVLADVPLDDEEVGAVTRFVDAGGRLVLAGQLATAAAGDLLPGGVQWQPRSGRVARPVVPAAFGLGDLTGIGTVRTAGDGGFGHTGAALPVLAAGRTPVAAVTRRGEGTVVLLADPSPLQNRLLPTGGNAAFGLAVAGPAGTPVVFGEAGHGYGQATGIDALPSTWRWALLVAAAATLTWMWSRARRLGPPDADDTEPPPRRRAYVDALAATLLRTGDPPGAIAPVQAAARDIVMRRAGLGPDAGDDLRRAALGLGLSEHDVDAIISPVHTHDDAVRAARALARLGGST